MYVSPPPPPKTELNYRIQELPQTHKNTKSHTHRRESNSPYNLGKKYSDMNLSVPEEEACDKVHAEAAHHDHLYDR